ncbi:MAG: hypothetical protein MN733_17470 [Nitrososphaera sp.]|nr:hypothetical protein [Nitrososphaera sp.]
MAPSSILSIIAGALMVAGGILTFSLFTVWTQTGIPGWGGGMMGGTGGMMGSGGMMSGGFMWGLGLGSFAISLGAGAVSIVGGYSIYKKPGSSSSWGIAILISGIVGLIGLSGFIIGPILGIIGGILALTRK